MSSFKIAAINPFTNPPEDCKYVVFTQQEAYISEEDAMELLKKTVRYCKHFGVYAVPFRFVYNDQLTMCMISPQGEIQGSQGAIHLNLKYRDKLKRSSDINIIETPDGKFFLSVDVDIFHPEVIRAASVMGAQVVISNRFMDKTHENNYKICCGAENAAVSNRLLVLDLSEEGSCFVDPMSGASCVRTQDKPRGINRVHVCDIEALNKYRLAKGVLPKNRIFKDYIEYLVR